MARRLTPEARRAEIITVAREVIASDGYRALSMREVRRCGMSAPGLMHYFPDMPTLLEAVLDARDEEDFATFPSSDGADASLVELIDAALAYYADRTAETARFDTLELEALDPEHPAHDYFVARNERTMEQLKLAIQREFENPTAVVKLSGLILDGMRLHALRDPEHKHARSMDGDPRSHRTTPPPSTHNDLIQTALLVRPRASVDTA